MRSVVILTTFVATLAGPLGSRAANFDEDTFERKSIPAYSIPTPARGGQPAESVIGQVRPYRIRKGDTLIDLARYYDLGYNEIVDANPAIDPWVPPAGATILLPTQWVLPCCTYEGIVVNIPEMRLFFYHRAPGDPHTTIIYTYPVGRRNAGERRLRASLSGGHPAPVPARAGRRPGGVRLPAGQDRRAGRRGLPGDAPGHLRLLARPLPRGDVGDRADGGRRPRRRGPPARGPRGRRRHADPHHARGEPAGAGAPDRGEHGWPAPRQRC